MTEYTMHIYAPATNIKAGIQTQKNIRDKSQIVRGGKFRCNHAPYRLKEMQEM